MSSMSAVVLTYLNTSAVLYGISKKGAPGASGSAEMLKRQKKIDCTYVNRLYLCNSRLQQLELFEGMISRNFPENFITQRPCTYNLLDYSTVILKLYMHYYYISLVKDKTYLHMYLTQLLCSLFKLKQLADHSVLRCGRLGWMKNFKTPFFKRY